MKQLLEHLAVFLLSELFLPIIRKFRVCSDLYCHSIINICAPSFVNCAYRSSVNILEKMCTRELSALKASGFSIKVDIWFFLPLQETQLILFLHKSPFLERLTSGISAVTIDSKANPPTFLVAISATSRAISSDLFFAANFSHNTDTVTIVVQPTQSIFEKSCHKL